MFTEWNKGELDSYLIDITSQIFAKKDDDGLPIVDKILDTAGQKGTGKWTCLSALDLGMPVTLIGEAVFSRCLSAIKEERVAASSILKGPRRSSKKHDRVTFVEDVRRALYCSKIISYAQGYMLLREAAKDQKWNLNFGGIALMWRGGCIIRSRFLGKIKEAFDKDPRLSNLLLNKFFTKALTSIRRVGGVPLPTRPSPVCPRLRLRRPWRFTMATAPHDCRPTCCRRNATSSAPTPTNASTSRAANSSTPTGRGAAARWRQAPITRRRHRYWRKPPILMPFGPRSVFFAHTHAWLAVGYMTPPALRAFGRRCSLS